MKNILPKILTIFDSFGSNLGHIIIKVCGCAESVISYLHCMQKAKNKEIEKKERTEMYQNIDEAVNTGSLDELFDLKRK